MQDDRTRWLAEFRLHCMQRPQGKLPVIGTKTAGGEAKFHQGVVGVFGVLRVTPVVIDLQHFQTRAQPCLFAPLEVCLPVTSKEMWLIWSGTLWR